MPLQWKKTMHTRISHLVNDHLHRSQKRRDVSSLVVETGFPTSLVDLFIKNREKLKKPSKKKRLNTPIPITPRSEINDSTSVSPSHSPMISSPRVFCEENRVLGSGVGLDERECVSDAGVDANAILLVVLKMFLVVVLALGTKRLTIGITISAFLLLFLEYVGKHARAVFEPSLEGKGVLKSTFESVLRLLRFNKVVELEEKVLIGIRYVNQEIQVVESNRYAEIEFHPKNEIIEVLGYQEIEPGQVIGSSACEVAEVKMKSRKSKIKSKIRKLVPKKLRGSRKGPGQQSVEIDVEEDSSVRLCDEPAVKYDDEMVLDNFTSELSSVSSWRYKGDDDKMSADDKMSVVRSFGKLSEMDETREDIESGFNWRCLMHCVIILAGLMGGRGFAVLLTLSWFLILKFGEKLSRYKKVPTIKPLPSN